MTNRISIFLMKFLFVLILLAASSCIRNTNRVNKGYYFEDFDNLKMWTQNQKITDEISHSGNFCTYTDNSGYSQTFEMDFEFAKSKRYRSMQVTAWCYKPKDDSNAGFIVSVESPSGFLVSKSTDFRTLEVSKTWINLHEIIRLPDSAPPDTKIKVYCWSPTIEKVFMDDVEIQFRK